MGSWQLQRNHWNALSRQFLNASKSKPSKFHDLAMRHAVSDSISMSDFKILFLSTVNGNTFVLQLIYLQALFTKCTYQKQQTVGSSLRDLI